MKLFKNKITNRKILSILSVSVFFLCISFGISFAQTGGNITGWAWGAVDSNHDGVFTPDVDGGIGWLSFSCDDLSSQCGVSNYGISLDGSGALSGYARSSNMGWITFNASDLSGCPDAMTSGIPCAAQVDLLGGGVTGWARSCSVFVVGCSGALNQNNGVWDGWIELSGINHASPGFSNQSSSGVTFDLATNSFFGYAWGGNDTNGTNNIGWISFGGYDQGDCLASVTHCPPQVDVYVGTTIGSLSHTITIPSNASTNVFWQPSNHDISCSTKTYEGPIGATVATGTGQWDHLVSQPVDMLDITAGSAGIATMPITNPSSTLVFEIQYEMTCANATGLTSTDTATVYVLPNNPSNDGLPVATIYANNVSPIYSPMVYSAGAFPLDFVASVPTPTPANHATATKCILTSNGAITHSGPGWTSISGGSTYSASSSDPAITVQYGAPVTSYGVPNINPLDIPAGTSGTSGGTPITFTINCTDTDGLTATSTATVVRFGPNPNLTYHIITGSFLVPSSSTAVIPVDGHVKLGWVTTDLVSCTNTLPSADPDSTIVTPWGTYPTGVPTWSTPASNPAQYDMTNTGASTDDPLLKLSAGVSTTFRLKCIDILNNPHIYPITLSPATAPGSPNNPVFEEF
jgi:hypothetical protein